jgi:hypothetical protein
MCTVIEIIPFDNVQGFNLLLRMNEKERNVEVIDHAIVIQKCVRYEYDDRI